MAEKQGYYPFPLRLQRQSNGQIISLNPSSTLGNGGEARVYTVPSEPTLVAKVYHKPTTAHAQKLVAMLANPPENPMAAVGHTSIAWPMDLLLSVDDNQRVVGFLMRRVQGIRSVLDFYNPKTRRQYCPLFNYFYLHRTARNLAAAVNALHMRGYCIGDVNESNILVSDTALVTLVDTDSFQVRDPNTSLVYRCPVGKPEYTPPELQGQNFGQVDRAIEHDLFGLAVVIFQLLNEGTHPFAGVFQGKGDPPPYETRIAAGHFAYSRQRDVPYLPSRISPPLEMLHPTLLQIFVRCFEDGHHDPQMRPSTQIWQDAIEEAENALVTCSANHQHRYGNHLSFCPWCERTLRLAGRDPFPSQQAVQQRQHLPPVKPRVRPSVEVKLESAPTRRTSPRLTPLFGTTPVKKPVYKRYSPYIVACIGLTAFYFLDLLVGIKLSSFNPKISASRFLNTSGSAFLNPITNTAKSWLAYYKQGLADYKHGHYEEAIENFDQALRLNPKDVKAYLNRGNTHYEIAQNNGDREQEYKVAIADFNQALHLNPHEAEAYLKRGIIRYKFAKSSIDPNREYKAAIADLNQTLRLNSHQAEAYLQRGIVCYEIATYITYPVQDYKRALSDFNQALRLNSNLAEAYLKRGIIRSQIAQYTKESVADYKATVADLKQAAKLFLKQGDIINHQYATSMLQLITDASRAPFQ